MSKSDKTSRTHRLTHLAITALAMSGDREAFSLIYALHHKGFLRLAFRLCGDHHAAQNITQNAAITMARKIESLKDPAAFSPWGYRIIRYRTQDYFRRQKRRGYMLPLKDEMTSTPHDVDIDMSISLRQNLEKLNPQDRRLLILFYIDGFTGVEIAAATGWPLGTVKSRLFAIRQKLKDNFNMEGDHNE